MLSTDSASKEATSGAGLCRPEPMAVMIFRRFLLAIAFFLALGPSVLKMYETSHWFREEDPSVYDKAKDWFAEAKIPYAKAFHHHEKSLMRVYFFVVPYILSAFLLAASHAIEGQFTSSRSKSDGAFAPPRSYLLLRSLLEQTWQTPHFAQRFLWAPNQISTAELLGIATYLTLNVGTFAVRVRRSLPRGTRKLLFLVDLDEDLGKEPIPNVSWEACEIWAKTLGILAILNLGWYLILPIGRRSVMLEAFCLSWERAVKYHRWIGYYTILLVLAHCVMYFGVWIYGNGHDRYDPEGNMIRRNMVPWGCGDGGLCDDDQKLQLRINMYGLVSFFFMMVMTVFTLPRIRRAHFEWFYYTHHLFIFVLFFLCLHYKGSFIYLIPGVAMYMVDKIFPLMAYRSAGTVETRLASPDVLEIFVPTATQGYYGGAYVFLNVPEVSWLEWHPFSLTSAPGKNGDRLVFHLKAAGTWTRAVLEAAAKARSEGSDLTVRIDGFYGHKVTENLSKKSAVVLVGGGIGVTPMVSVARDLVKNAPTVPVTLLWIVRTVAEACVLTDELTKASKHSSGELDVRVWVTLSQPEPHLDDTEQPNLLTKDNVGDLSHEEQVIALSSTISTIRSASSHKHLTTDSKVERAVSQSYMFHRLGFTPTTNALVMGMSAVVALSSYALTWHWGETKEFEPEDKLSLLHMTMIVVCVPVFMLIIECTRYLYRGYGTSIAGSPGEGETKHFSDLSGSDKFSSDKSDLNNFDSDSPKADDEELFASMVKGRIGCRPDFALEFSKIKTASGSDDFCADAGVLACGPLAMVKSITKICNTPDSGCAWGKEQEDGPDVFFSFTEEDWEW